MEQNNGLQTRIASHYPTLSARLRDAADFVLAHPLDIATRSLRTISTESGLSPATFSRLARALGFDTYEDMRELSRSRVGTSMLSFSEKARLLREETGHDSSMIFRQGGACIDNISAMMKTVDPAMLERAVSALAKARSVVLFGALGSTGIAEYMAYLANYFAPNWILAGRMGSSLGGTLSTLGRRDVVILVTKTPYAKRAVAAAQTAQHNGARTIVLTDHHACPALRHADFGFIVPSDSPQFFSSYAATLVLIETIIAMLTARQDDNVGNRIKAVEEGNRSLGEFWAD